MKTLRLYVFRSFITTFLATVAVLTFIISIGGLFKITDLLAKGIEAGPILQVFLSGLPNAISYAVPVGTLTAALLVFGRLSGDSEIVAMRACGISIAGVAGWLFPFALIASLACVYVNSELVPLQHYIRWRATGELRADSALSLLEVGRTVSLGDDLRIFVGSLHGDGSLEQIRIFDERDTGGMREIKAARGVLEEDAEAGAVWLALERVTIDPFQFGSPGAAYSERWRLLLSQRSQRVYVPRDKYQNFVDLHFGAVLREQEADELARARALFDQANLLRQNAYEQAEAVREIAWRAYREGESQLEAFRLRAAAAAAEDTAAALRLRGRELFATAQQMLSESESASLEIEQSVQPKVQLLLRQARELERGSGEPETRLRERAMDMRIILNQRVLLSFSPLLFLYFGIPMGVRSHRRETSGGIASSLAVMFLFYIVLSLFGEFKGHPHLRPDRLVWIPGLLLLIADVVLLRRLR